ncbi:isopentenyl-diphosphate delta-isomerase, type 2 [Pyrobaculum islandicum DSM 4184]|uniref:Isopentenyl-diphosphate delta-isomerase n=1 Tax=Pyrobaculum islandicum (strain DSM 4184 / JCM 9189 / GEO3) TaxID=384616 RepID=IDI2_PYRIL|nr:type 2 isopentenyl-diphosphate Delta-isomerase [Pyrobaculum islandicum]A1RTI3.1 RecName: Full=Isopentenyl-diphosphate delta-isomerase; Short=IPP isomerase; AltName: Full=Isopentenyl diphosphate:dimethylallyl diphosphate isomerase; AltName: Full=Isopentenyl pyrophosphate isomerase; AltName: Full=Type 2 isopentenyl diphosphate isomerase; Short=IDI-2 [Pyrobaculum islandicum DSM 4184]ABL88265.1 isopentenyl-diphosphate delta-isomerase, type 2 [Pyrobaculum islandicum DSM 4184]
MAIDKRKNDHIYLASSEISQVGSPWFDEVILLHNALPEIDLSEVDITTRFLGVKVNAPFGIGAMTGGTELAGKINAELAKIAEEFGIPIYVGSQRVALMKPEVRWTFEVVKKNAPSVPKVANLGAPQLAELSDEKLAEWVSQAVDMIDAYAIAIHLNAAQEVIQPEGEPRFRGVFEKIKVVRKAAGRPVIVKEVGNGISKEVASRLVEVADAIDVGGYGGTSFIAIEGARAAESGSSMRRRVAEVFKSWGIPTAASICEARSGYRGYIIASGGIRSGLDGAKALALGADFFTMSQPFLKAALEGRLREEIETVIAEVKIAMFLTGSRTIEDLKSAPRVYGPRLRNWIEQRKLVC